jgi:hypothetical protein
LNRIILNCGLPVSIKTGAPAGYERQELMGGFEKNNFDNQQF